jgi:hypothetical protein
MPLTEMQEKALEVLDWLNSDGHRQEGRSFVQAVSIVRYAVAHPGTTVYPEDHAGSLVPHRRDVQTHLARILYDLSDSSGLFLFINESPRLSVTYNRVRFDNWLPQFHNLGTNPPARVDDPGLLTSVFGGPKVEAQPATSLWEHLLDD